MLRGFLFLVLLFSTIAVVEAETVEVKYRGPVDLAPFSCTDTPRSSFIGRVCYDRPNQYMSSSYRTPTTTTANCPQRPSTPSQPHLQWDSISIRTSKAVAVMVRMIVGRIGCPSTDEAPCPSPHETRARGIKLCGAGI